MMCEKVLGACRGHNIAESVGRGRCQVHVRHQASFHTGRINSVMLVRVQELRTLLQDCATCERSAANKTYARAMLAQYAKNWDK